MKVKVIVGRDIREEVKKRIKSFLDDLIPFLEDYAREQEKIEEMVREMERKEVRKGVIELERHNRERIIIDKLIRQIKELVKKHNLKLPEDFPYNEVFEYCSSDRITPYLKQEVFAVCYLDFEHERIVVTAVFEQFSNGVYTYELKEIYVDECFAFKEK